MTKWKYQIGLFTAVMMSVGTLAWSGCNKSTLAPGGAYAPATFVTNADGTVTTTQTVMSDMAFYITEASFLLAASTIDTAFRFEAENEMMLWRISPEIKHTMDKIRPDATQAVMAYKAARNEYKKHPTPTGLDLLQTLLSKVQQVATSAAAAVQNINTNK
jgi:hypothetical protein